MLPFDLSLRLSRRGIDGNSSIQMIPIFASISTKKLVFQGRKTLETLSDSSHNIGEIDLYFVLYTVISIACDDGRRDDLENSDYGRYWLARRAFNQRITAAPGAYSGAGITDRGHE